MKQYYKFFCMLFTCVFFASCSGGTNSFTWFVDAIPANLDPQIANTSQDIIACTNLHGMLMREDEAGTLQLDLAQSYQVSDDGKTYTFTLKDGLTYYNRSNINTTYPLTADDFVFAFARIFTAETQSPYASLYASIKNSTAVFDGNAPVTQLGVSAPDDKTVVFTLDVADDAFLETLALPAAAPCNQAFFESTKGTYGLTSKTTLSSGSFYLYNWTATGLFLRRNAETGMIDSLRLVENSNSAEISAETLITEEKCTAVTDDSADATLLKSISYSDTTWGLLYNQNTVLADQNLRTALSCAARDAALTAMGTFDPDIEGLIPAGIDVEGVDYRAEHGGALPALTSATEAFSTALTTLSMNDLKGITILIPTGHSLEAYVGAINETWQKDLALYFSVEAVDETTFYSRIATGDYTIALAPIVVTQNDLISFMSNLNSNYHLGYTDPVYTTLLQLSQACNGTEKRALLYQAEQMLLESVTITPLFSQQKRLLIDPAVDHLVFDPFGPVIDVTFATKS